MAKSEFKSEIRDSQINQLLEKAANRNYGRYLARIVLKKVRGFSDESISFDFPVTAVIGPNGGGKTTILGAAACAYKQVSPRRFFAKSGKYDESMQGWSVEYEIVDKNINQKGTFQRTATFKNARWSRDAPERSVLVFGVSRTVPANERSELAKYAASHFSVPDSQIDDFPEILQSSVSRILGKDVKGFKRIRIAANGNVTLLAGITKSGNMYSEFHFGAGESSIIRMVFEIEAAVEHSLVLIEEIENGLHPIATIRLVEYLIGVAERKKVQVVFTTHSNEALQVLPSKAIWAATQDKIFQGKLNILSLRAITGQIEKFLVIFVEDKFAQIWMEAIIRQSREIPIEHVEICAMEGDDAAVKACKYHNNNPTITTQSICYIDGDSKQKNDDIDVYRLPGESPENYIFDAVIEKWDNIGGHLTVALLQDFQNKDRVKEKCDSVRRESMDVHLLYAKLGEQLDLIPEQTVIQAFTNIWAQSNREELERLVAPARKILKNLGAITS
jgi:predicted ATPase